MLSLKKLIDKHRQKTQGIDLSRTWHDPIHFITCGFGLGLLPMPGTFGTLLGALIAWGLHFLPIWLYIGTTTLLCLVGIFLCDKVNRDLNTDDHPAAVWDEVATFPIVMIAIPFTWINLLIGFLLFRFFDIVKPGPIGWIDNNIHGGAGVMLDDVAAAIVSLGFLHGILFLCH